ncbi:MAG: DUF928 domain-containing protein [Pseudanabaenaceae cyanobacterium]
MWAATVVLSWSAPAAVTAAERTESKIREMKGPAGVRPPAKSPTGEHTQPSRRSPNSPMVTPTYVPPAGQVPPRTRGWTAGRRGCVWAANPEASPSQALGENPGEQKLTPLAPLHHLGKTAQTHPTFVWFGEHGDGAPVEFSLYAYDGTGGRLAPVPIYQKSLLATAGPNAFTLPATVPPLQPGQIYAWQVVLQPACNAHNENPARNPWLRSAFQVVAPQPAASAAQMAAQGLWYDALATAWQSGETAQFASLLHQLADLEAQQEPPEQPLVARLSYALRRIAASPVPEVRAAIAPF